MTTTIKTIILAIALVMTITASMTSAHAGCEYVYVGNRYVFVCS